MNVLATFVVVVHLAILASCENVLIQEDEAFHDILGKSIYVPSENLLGTIPNGITFFDAISKDCLRNIDQAITTKHQTFYKDTESLYKSISTETNLKASYESAFTLGLTLDVTTKQVSGSKREVKGTSLKLKTKKNELQLSPNCLYESGLQERLLSDFSALKTKVPSPWLKSSWRDYQSFLRTHGSHVITGVTYGSSVDQYAFAEESSSYSTRDLTVKACADLQGLAAGSGKLGVSACSGVTTEEKQDASHKRMTSTITVKGGTPATRSKLLYQRTDELMIQFLEEGNTHAAPIQYELTPIWQILKRQKNTLKNGRVEANVRALTLEYYFDGYLNFGCDYQKGLRGPPLQMFNLAENSMPDNPVYECTLAGQGCHSDDDCHYHVGVWCNCAGNSCVRHTETKAGTSGSKLTAKPYQQSDWGWHGCDWQTWGSTCACLDGNKERLRVY